MQATLKAHPPEETEVEAGDGEEQGSKLRDAPRAYKGSTRPWYIDTRSWAKLQYHERVEIAGAMLLTCAQWPGQGRAGGSGAAPGGGGFVARYRLESSLLGCRPIMS